MNDRVDRLVRNPAFVPTTTGIVSFAVGFALGYFIPKWRRKEEYELLDPRDLSPLSTKRRFVVDEADEQVIIRGEPVEIIQEQDDEDEDEETEDGFPHVVTDDDIVISIAEHIEEDEITIERRTIFAQPVDGDWNFETEVAKRAFNVPYVIHRDEYFAEERGFRHTALIWYEGDRLMADDNGELIYNWEPEYTGPLMFGHGSGDPNVFYVRNEKRKEEYEVFRSTDHYTRAVQGLEIEDEVSELQHSHAVMKFRLND